MIDTGLHCDVSDNPYYRGNYQAALNAIQAKTFIMPATTDLYFMPKDCAAEAASILNSEYCTIPSIWGHRAGDPYQNPTDEALIRLKIHTLLDIPLLDPTEL